MAQHRSFEEKRLIVEYYLKNGDLKTTAEYFDVDTSTISKWLLSYQEKGVSGLEVLAFHNSYSNEFKMMVIHEYLNNNISYHELTRKYNIRSHATVRRWVLKYTEGKKLKSTFGGTRLMMKSRKTTYEVRLKIAQYHESNEISIRRLSELFEVSYQQAYQYVKKYEASGQEGLEDRRGRRKSKGEWTEVEQLKRELELERRKRKKTEVENAFLKKLEELERRRQ